MSNDIGSVTNILIIGCSGFIGSHLIERLLEERTYTIIGWDVDHSKLTIRNDPNLVLRKQDYADEESKSDLVRDVVWADTVINLAAICNPSQYNVEPLKVIRSNFINAYTLVDICSDHHKWLIHFSTSEVYGRTISSYVKGESYQDRDLFELREDETPLIMGPVDRQRWTYACAKQLLERYIVAHNHEHGMEYTIVRPLNFFGPRMDFIPGVDGDGVPRVLACFMEALMRGEPMQLVDGGLARRTILSIEDAIRAIATMLKRPDAVKGQVFNIGNPNNEVTMKELAHMMRRIYGEITQRPVESLSKIISTTALSFYGKGYEDCDRRQPNIDKAARLLDWHPAVSLEETLQQTIRYYWDQYGSRVAG